MPATAPALRPVGEPTRKGGGRSVQRTSSGSKRRSAPMPACAADPRPSSRRPKPRLARSAALAARRSPSARLRSVRSRVTLTRPSGGAPGRAAQRHRQPAAPEPRTVLAQVPALVLGPALPAAALASPPAPSRRPAPRSARGTAPPSHARRGRTAGRSAPTAASGAGCWPPPPARTAASSARSRATTGPTTPGHGACCKAGRPMGSPAPGWPRSRSSPIRATSHPIRASWPKPCGPLKAPRRSHDLTLDRVVLHRVAPPVPV